VSGALQQFSLHGRNDLTTHPHLTRPVVDHSRTQHDQRRSTNLIPLLDPQGKAGLGEDTMLQEVRAQERCAIARGRVLTHPVSVEEEPRTQIVLAVMGLGAEEVDEGREPFGGRYAPPSSGTDVTKAVSE